MMECTTGLTDDEFDGLLAWLREEGVEGRPPILGLSGSLTATLMYLRQNIVQAVIGEVLGVSQPTVSRAIKALTEAISRTLVVLLLTAEDVPRDCDYVVDGTLLPCPGWRGRRDLWSVKHGRAGRDERPGSWSGSTEGSCGPRTPIRGPCTTWRPWTPPDCSREWTPPGGSATRGTWEGG